MSVRFNFTILISFRPLYPLGIPLPYSEFVFGVGKGRFLVSVQSALVTSPGVFFNLFVRIHSEIENYLDVKHYMGDCLTNTQLSEMVFTDIMPWGINNRHKLIKCDFLKKVYLASSNCHSIVTPFHHTKLHLPLSGSQERVFLLAKLSEIFESIKNNKCVK